jgi:hypothetical protein
MSIKIEEKRYSEEAMRWEQEKDINLNETRLYKNISSKVKEFISTKFGKDIKIMGKTRPLPFDEHGRPIFEAAGITDDPGRPVRITNMRAEMFGETTMTELYARLREPPQPPRLLQRISLFPDTSITLSHSPRERTRLIITTPYEYLEDIVEIIASERSFIIEDIDVGHYSSHEVITAEIRLSIR